jgi:hypothetical protein
MSQMRRLETFLFSIWAAERSKSPSNYVHQGWIIIRKSGEVEAEDKAERWKDQI